MGDCIPAGLRMPLIIWPPFTCIAAGMKCSPESISEAGILTRFSIPHSSALHSLKNIGGWLLGWTLNILGQPSGNAPLVASSSGFSYYWLALCVVDVEGCYPAGDRHEPWHVCTEDWDSHQHWHLSCCCCTPGRQSRPTCITCITPAVIGWLATWLPCDVMDEFMTFVCTEC